MLLADLAEQLDAVAPQLTSDLLDQAGTCVLDALACAYGGQELPWVTQARAVVGPVCQGELSPAVHSNPACRARYGSTRR